MTRPTLGDPVQSAGVSGTVLDVKTFANAGANVVAEVYVQWAEPTGDIFLVGVLGASASTPETTQQYPTEGAR